jgi:uncharacterized membrane protein YphA (DoxX/SURF4 family)
LVDPASLGIYRILFVLYLLVRGPPSFSWLGSMPQGMYLPPRVSLAALFDGFPPLGSLVLLDLVIVISLLAVLVGFKTRWFTALLLLAILVGNGFRYSFGKIDHGILLEGVLFVMVIVRLTTYTDVKLP